MASLNKVQIIGNLGRDPEIRHSASGGAVANVAVATSYKPKDQEAVTEWHRIVFFGRLAEIVGEYTRKGSSIYVEGRLQTRKYTDKDGIERYVTEIVGENMQLLGGRDAGQGDSGAPVREQARGQGHNGQRQQSTGDDYQRARNGQPPRPQPKPAPNFSDMDDDIPF